MSDQAIEAGPPSPELGYEQLYRNECQLTSQLKSQLQGLRAEYDAVELEVCASRSELCPIDHVLQMGKYITEKENQIADLNRQIADLKHQNSSAPHVSAQTSLRPPQLGAPLGHETQRRHLLASTTPAFQGFVTKRAYGKSSCGA